MRNWHYIIIIALLVSFSCRKESFYNGGNITLKFSQDTVAFDTVFTEIGTLTKQLMVYNPYSDAVKISSIKLAGNPSPFIINISGVEKEATDITIEAGDSLYIFVQVLLQQTLDDLPHFIKDSILFITNGNQQDVKLTSYAQDVYMKKDTIQSETWSGKKPYLIYGNLVVDSAQTLTINSGVTVYMHKNANIIINGNIQAYGSFYDPIVFKQDRLDKDYKDIPGYWGSISIAVKPGSGPQNFDWVTIENGTGGLQIINLDSLNNSAALNISNTIIQNMSFVCLLSAHTSVYASNCLIANARNYACYLDGGGTFQFIHSTIANYYSPYDNRKSGFTALYLSNYLINDKMVNGYEAYDISNSFFRNCIIYGTFSNELIMDFKEEVSSDVVFDYCLIRSENNNVLTKDFPNQFSKIIWNEDPKFINAEYLKFELDTLSPAIDVGDYIWGTYAPYDLKNESHTIDGKPDLGAYERKIKK